MAVVDFAVVVGIGRYHNLAPHNPLEGPIPDAKEFYAWLVDYARMDSSNIAFVVSDDYDKADRPIIEDINKAFDYVFDRAANEQRKGNQPRRLYLYFAGHGCALEFDHVALIMANASEKNLNYSLNTVEYHDGLIRQAIFEEHVIFYDCCRNFDKRVVGQRPPWSIIEYNSRAARTTQYVLYAAGFTQYGYERKMEFSTRRGLFTRALLEGLKGKAAKEEAGRWVVTTDSLRPYVERRLDQLAKSQNVQQLPTMNIRGQARDITLAVFDQTPESMLGRVTIVPQTPANSVVVKNYKLTEVMRVPWQTSAITIDLPIGLYCIGTIPEDHSEIVEVGVGSSHVVNL